jgi:uncharacterized protein (DUF2249 family)
VSRKSYDLRALAAPEPMMRIIMAFDALAKGDAFEAVLPHAPTPIYGHLRERGAEWEILADEPGRFVLLVKKAA